MSGEQPSNSDEEKRDFEQEFLELPNSQLVLKVREAQRAPEKEKQPLWAFILGSKKTLFAISAFLVAIGPLYQLNIAAWKLVQQPRANAEMLETAEALIAAGAMDEARSELERAKSIDATHPKLLDLSAVIELERSLRLDQTPRALRVFEIRFKETLARNAQAAYLLGTAYIGSDLERADKYLALSQKCSGGQAPVLAAR